MNSEFLTPILLTLKVSVVSTLAVTIIGTFIGKICGCRKFKGKRVVETMFFLPLVLPPSVVGFLLIMVFGNQSIIGRSIVYIFHQPIIFTWWAAVIASFVVSFPLMYQSAKLGFLQIEPDIENAARLDGANEWQTFINISIPLAWPSLLSGCIISFCRALGEFGATLMFAGNIPGKTQTISTAIYMAIDMGNLQLAWKWVSSMIVISFFLLYLTQLKRNK